MRRSWKLGTVQQDDGGPNVLIRFQAKDGQRAERWIPRSEVQSADGSRTGGNAEQKRLSFITLLRAAFRSETDARMHH